MVDGCGAGAESGFFSESSFLSDSVFVDEDGALAVSFGFDTVIPEDVNPDEQAESARLEQRVMVATAL